MKIIIGTTVVPHIFGGGTQIIDWLELKLKEYGHEVECVRLPHTSAQRAQVQQLLAMRLYHLEDYAERLICVRFPSYLLKHPDKYLWFIHHYREVYDLYDTEFGVKDTPEGRTLREYYRRADAAAFAEAKKIYTNSKIISKRLLAYNGVQADPVYPPLLEPEKLYCEGYGDFIYYPSRICGPKRQGLAMEAMKYTKSGVKLLITGALEGSYGKTINALLADPEIAAKVTVKDEWITEEEKRKNLANCLAVAYIPLDEDSYGYPSLEAHHSRKAVISCTDSGGTDELIEDGRNGFLAESDPRALAAIFDQLYEDKKLAERMGEAGLARIGELDITWDNIIGRFTA